MHSKRIQQKVKDDYNEIAKDFSESRKLPWKDFNLFLPYYDSNFSILDLGCGNGRLLTFLNKYGFKNYLGVDLSEALVDLAKKNHPERDFLVADMSDLTGLEQVDAIFAIASFHHVPPNLQLETLKKWKKLLKPGGYIFMTNWNLHQLRFWKLWFKPRYSFFSLLVPWKDKLKRYYFAFSKRRLSLLLRKSGFEVEFQEYVSNGECANIWSGKNILTICRNEDL